MVVLMEKEEEIISKFKASCEADVKDSQEKYKQLEGQEKTLKIWIAKIENENDSLSMDLASSKKDFEHIVGQLKESKNELKEKDQKLLLINNECLLLQEESVNVQKELNAIKNEHRLCKIPEHFSDQLQKLQDSLNSKNIIIEIQDEKINSLTMQELQLSSSLKAEKKKNKDFLDVISNQSNQLQIQEQLCKNYNDDLNKKNIEIDKLISDLRLKENELKTHGKTCKTQSESVVDEYKELLFHLKDHPPGLVKKLNSVAHHFKILKSVVDLFKDKLQEEELVSTKQIKTLETILAEKNTICQELTSKVNKFDEICTRNNKLEENIRVQEELLKVTMQNLEKKTNEYSDVLLKSEELERRLEVSQMEHNKSRQDYGKLCKDLLNLKTSYKSEIEQNHKLTEKLELLLKQKNLLKIAKEAVEKELSEFKFRFNGNEHFFQQVGTVLQETPCSLSEVLFIITDKMTLINELQEKLETIQNLNKKLYTDFESTNDKLCTVLKREKILDDQYKVIKEERDSLDKECDMLNTLLNERSEDLYISLRQCSERESDIIELKAQLTETKQNLLEKSKCFDSLLKDNDSLKLVISRYEDDIREYRREKGKMMLQISEYKNKVKSSEVDIEQLKIQDLQRLNEIKEMKNLFCATRTSSKAECHCEELKNEVSELKLTVADRNRKLIDLELQTESNNIPFKKKINNLEKSLEQAKQKTKELKSESQHYQIMTQETSMRDCEICRRRFESQVHASVQTICDMPIENTPSSSCKDQDTLEQKCVKCKSKITTLKKICWSRKKRIEDLEKELRSEKESRPVLGVKKNENVPP